MSTTQRLPVRTQTAFHPSISEAERQVRIDLAACYRLVDLFGMSDMILNHISARVPGDEEHFLINPFGMMYEEITASSLIKVDLDGNVIYNPNTEYTINLPGFVILAASVLAALRLPLLIAGVVIAFGLGVPDQRVVRNAGAHDQWLYPDLVPDHIQYGLAARTLEQHMRPGDGIVYSERWQVWLNDIGLAYHMRGKPMPRDVFLEQTAVEVGDFWVKECDDLAACLRNEERIWIVSVDIEGEDSPWDRLEPEKVAVLRDDYTVVERWEQGPLRGINLTLLVRNDLL